MITKIGVPFKGLAGDGFSGSYKGMRFFMKTYDKENITVYAVSYTHLDVYKRQNAC